MKYGKSYSSHTGKRSILKRVISSPLFLIAIAILFVIMARATWGIRDKALTSVVKLDQARSELDKLKTRESDLTALVDRLSTDQGVESEIRTKYKGVRDGESLAVIINDDEDASVTQATSTASVGWFKGLLQKIGL